MEINQIDKGNCKKELQISLNSEELENYFEKAYKEYSKDLKIDGFRKGKAPVHIVKRKYGERIKELAITDFVPQEVFNEFIDANKINVIGKSKLINIDRKEDDSVTYIFEYEFIPEVELDTYKNIEVTKESYIIDDTIVEEELENLLMKHSTRAMDAQVFDDKYIVTVDFQALDKAGTIIIGESAKDIELYVGDERLNKNLYEALKNIKEGEEKVVELPITNDENTPSNVESKTQLYKLSCKKVEKIVYPDLNEEFFKKVTEREDIKTTEEFKNYLKESIQKYYDELSQQHLLFSIIQEIIKLNDIDIPDTYVDSVLDAKYDEYLKHISEHHNNETPLTKEEFIKENRPDIIFNLKWYLISEKIIQKENIAVSDEDYLKFAENEKKRFQFDIEVDKLVEMLKEDKKFESKLLDNKLMNFLIENSKIKIEEKPLTKKENKIIS